MDTGSAISRTNFPTGYTLFVFDLSPDLIDGGHFDLVKHGNLRLEIHFARPLLATNNTIVNGEFDNILQIDRKRVFLLCTLIERHLFAVYFLLD